MAERLPEEQLRILLDAVQNKHVTAMLQAPLNRVLTERQRVNPEPPFYDVSIRHIDEEAELRGNLQGLEFGLRIALGETNIQGPAPLVRLYESFIGKPLSQTKESRGTN